MLQFLHQMFNVSSLLLDDALKPAGRLCLQAKIVLHQAKASPAQRSANREATDAGITPL